MYPVRQRMSIPGGQCRGFCTYRVDRIGRVARDSGVIVRVHRLGVRHQRCFNQMPCMAAINPAYPPSSGSISHAQNTSYSAKALMSPFYRRSTLQRLLVHTSSHECVRSCCCWILATQKNDLRKYPFLGEILIIRAQIASILFLGFCSQQYLLIAPI